MIPGFYKISSNRDLYTFWDNLVNVGGHAPESDQCGDDTGPARPRCASSFGPAEPGRFGQLLGSMRRRRRPLHRHKRVSALVLGRERRLLMTMTDHCPLGTSMLKKLGWSEGKGLGPREQGRKEPVAVRPKRDNGGIGTAASSTTRPGLGLASGLLGSVPGLKLAGQSSVETVSLDEVFERIRKGRRKGERAKRGKSKRTAEGTQPLPSPAKRVATEQR